MCIRIHISILAQTYHCALLRRQTDPDVIKVYDAEAQVIETRAAAMNATRSSAPLTDGTVLDEEPCPAGTMPRLDPGAQAGEIHGQRSRCKFRLILHGDEAHSLAHIFSRLFQYDIYASV